MNMSDLTNKNPEVKLRSLLSLNDKGVQEIILFLQSHRDANYLIDLAMNDPVVSLHYNRLGYLINALHIQRRAEQRDMNVHSYAFSGVRAITQAAVDKAIPVEAKIPQEQFAQSITSLTQGHEEGHKKTIVTAYLRWLAKKDTEYPDHSLGVVKKIYQIVMLLKQTEEGEVNAGSKVSSCLVIASLYESAIVYKDRDDKMFPPYDFSCHPGTEARLLDIVWPMFDSVVEDKSLSKSLSTIALVRMIASAHQDMFYQTVDMGHVKEPGLNLSFVKDLNRRIQQKLESNPAAIHKIEESSEVPIGIPKLMKCYEAVNGRYMLKQDVGIEGVQQDLPKQFDNIAALVTWGRGNKHTIVSTETVLRDKDAFVGEILQDIEIACSKVFDPVLLYMPFATVDQPGKAHFQQICSEYIEGRIAEYDASQAGIDEWGLSQQKEAVEAANAGISEEETPEDLKEYPYFDLGKKIEAALESIHSRKTLLVEKLWNSADVGIDYVSIVLEDISHPMQLKLVNNLKRSRKITAQNYEACLGNRVYIAILLMQSDDKSISGPATEFIEQKVLPEGQYVCKRLQELGLYGALDTLINCIANMQDKLRLDLEFGGHNALDILSSDLLSLELLTTPDCRGHNTLMSAAYYGHTEVVKAILTRDKILAQVMLTTKDRDGQNALMLASKAGHTEVVKTFLAFKHLSNQVLLEKTKEGKNALMLAIGCGHREVTKEILALDNLPGQMLLEKNRGGENALVIAIKEYSLIIRMGVRKRFDQHSDMMKAILARDDLPYFVQTGMHDVESLLGRVISLAICDGDTGLAKAFLAREDLPISDLTCDAPIYPFISPLKAAVSYGYIEILTMIVNKLANAGKLTFSDRQYLLRNGYFMLSFTENKSRLEAGGDIGADSVVVAAGNKSSIRLSSQWFHQVPTEKAREGKNELMLAAWLGQKKIVQGILAQDDLSDQMLIEKDAYGRNALVMAVMNGHTEVAKLILTRDSLPDQVLTDCYQGRNPLMWAALFGYVGVAELIVSRRNLPHQVLTTEDGNDENALMVAATYNHLEVVEVILARLDLPDEAFMTTAGSDKNILMKAILDGNINLAEVVLARDNLPPSIFKNGYSDNVLTQAIEDGYIKIAKAILARPNLPAEALVSYDSLGRTPLGLAAFYDYQEIAKAILDRDDLIKTAEFLNYVIWAQFRDHCALTIAASHGHIDIIKAVLSQKHFSASLLINDANPILSQILESGYRPSTAVLELIVTQYAKLGVLTFSERWMLLRAGYVMLAFTANKSQLTETPLNTAAASTLYGDDPDAIVGPNNENAEGHHLDLRPGAEQPGL